MEAVRGDAQERRHETRVGERATLCLRRRLDANRLRTNDTSYAEQQRVTYDVARCPLPQMVLQEERRRTGSHNVRASSWRHLGAPPSPIS